MEELMRKYANVLLKSCLKVKDGQPLFISANLERIDFVRIVTEIACEMGVKDIYYDLSDPIIKHTLLKHVDEQKLKDNQYWIKTKWSEYAAKEAAFLMLASESPGLMSDISPEKLNDLAMFSNETRKGFENLRHKGIVPWCIAAVPTLSWAKEIFPESSNPLEDLWNKIFEICSINKDNPEEIWNNKIDKLKERSDKLTSYQFKKLRYTNSLGTNFEIGLPENHIWCSGRETLENGNDYLANFPTLEVFTSPANDTATGIVYSSKPLAYQDNLIKNFWIKFQNGKAIDCGAEEGLEILKTMINSCEGSNKLGEVALVEYDSEISQSGLIFYETLFDENASCHLALGESFPECIKDGRTYTKEELLEHKMNQSKNHVDFMVGTKDLNIIGITPNGEEITIFENGNFSPLFK